MDPNQAWANRIIHRIDPAFKHRWEAYDEAVAKALGPETVWIDCGCGDNGIVRHFAGDARLAVGTDVLEPNDADDAFVTADVRRLPFASGVADLITLRFVVEHFPDVEPYMSEVERVLKPGGMVIILTTNTLSPLILLPRLLLPYPLKHRILTKLFKVDAVDIFPTYHKMNTPGSFRRVGGLRLSRLDLISDLNFTRRWVFWILFVWHVLTMPRGLHRFRMNILALLEKS